MLLLLVLFTSCLTGFYILYKKQYQYWKKRNVPFLQPCIPFGNVPIFWQRTANSQHIMSRLYKEAKRKGLKYCGLYFFMSPFLLVVDLEQVKNIFAGDFDYFTDRAIYYNEKDDPLSAHVHSLGGTRWKTLRKHLNPGFTSSKIKTFFPVTKKCIENFIQKIERENKRSDVDIRNLISGFTLKNLAGCVFGLEGDMFEKENSPFYHYVKKSLKISIFVQMVTAIFPELARKLHFRFIPKDSSTFFMHLVDQTLKHRDQRNRHREDFLQVLIDLKNSGSLTFKEVAAQCYIFFVAGFETSTALTTYVLYELAKNQKVQNGARKEINSVLSKYQNEICHESLADLKYMDQILDETTRKYSSGYFLTRRCVKDYKIPDENVFIEKGTTLIIPVQGIHYDEEYYPDPARFLPERFTKEEKSLRHPYTHLPFGEGPRTCIGKRFAIMQVKSSLAALLKSYKFTVSSNTPEPLDLDMDSLVVAPKQKILLNMQKINN